MNHVPTFAAAAAALLAFSATAADATVFLGLQANGGAIVTVDSGAFAAGFFGAFGDFELNLTGGTAGIAPVLLGSTSLNSNTGGTNGRLDVYLTVDNIAGPIPTSFKSTFSSNEVPAGWTVSLESIFGGGAYGAGGTQLASASFTDNGTSEVTTGGFGGAGPYQLTAHYTLIAVGRGQTETSIEIANVVVPEPATWSLMIAGFGAAGAMIRRKRALARV